MAFCVLKENISARTWPNQRINKVILAVKYNVFIAVKIVDHTTVSRILGLAWLTLRKWLPMLARLNIVLRNTIIRAKMIYVDTIKKKFATIPHEIFGSLK